MKQVLFSSYHPISEGGSKSVLNYHRKCDSSQHIYKTRQSFCNHKKLCAISYNVKILSNIVKFCFNCKKTFKCHESFYEHKKNCNSLPSYSRNGLPTCVKRPNVLNNPLKKQFTCGKINNHDYPRKCDSCQRSYKTKQSFCNHKKICPNFCTGKNWSNLVNGIHICDSCKRTFRNHHSFYIHKEKCSRSAPAKITHKCSICSLSFNNALSYCRHVSTCSNSTDTIPCPIEGCDVKLSSGGSMLNHLKIPHIHGVTQILHFDSLSEFYEWKLNEDKKNFSYSKKASGTTISVKNVKTYSFACMFNNTRSRIRDMPKTARRRSYGQIPSGSCPSKIVAKEFEDGSVKVKYISSHSHPLRPENLVYHRWNTKTLQAVKKYLQEGLSPSAIRKKFILPENSQEPYPLKEQFMTNKQIGRYKYRLRKMQNDPEYALSNKQHIGENPETMVYKQLDRATCTANKLLDLKLPSNPKLFFNSFKFNCQMKKLEVEAHRSLCINEENMEHGKCLKLSDCKVKNETSADIQNHCHIKGVLISPSSVYEISENMWKLESEGNKNISYIVTLQLPHCILPDHCFYRCSSLSCLGLCSHLFKCSCPDVSNLCEHVHRVYSLVSKDYGINVNL